MTNQLGSGNTGKWFGNTTAAAPDKTYIGATRFNGSDAGFFHGVIDDVRIYDRELTASEISTLPVSGSATEFQWLVADQLGTPRMVFDRTGSLASTKRHDYLPFGEELFGGMGGRTTALGYTSDTIRQKFTSKERDNETGLDYFLARYYTATHGRFTSPDEFTGGTDELYNFADDASANPTFYAELENPQSLNKYQYTYNNPLRYNDPTGHCPTIPGCALLSPYSRRFLR